MKAPYFSRQSYQHHRSSFQGPVSNQKGVAGAASEPASYCAAAAAAKASTSHAQVPVAHRHHQGDAAAFLSGKAHSHGPAIEAMATKKTDFGSSIVERHPDVQEVILGGQGGVNAVSSGCTIPQQIVFHNWQGYEDKVSLAAMDGAAFPTDYMYRPSAPQVNPGLFSTDDPRRSRFVLQAGFSQRPNRGSL